MGAQLEKAVPVQQHRFGAGPEYTLGIEEELMLIDADDGWRWHRASSRWWLRSPTGASSGS